MLIDQFARFAKHLLTLLFKRMRTKKALGHLQQFQLILQARGSSQQEHAALWWRA
jgi:hypothetical protein